jgi:uncharacterized protein
MTTVEAKRDAAVEDLRSFDGVLVAFSGGVDSSVVAALAHEALGEDAVACTAKSETLPAAELEDATRVAEGERKYIKIKKFPSDRYNRT